MVETEEGKTVFEQYVKRFNDYFNNYDVQQLMLSEPSILAYKNAIINSADQFKDKVVMDVGAGTGILSVFCAKAGARKVYAVEACQFASTTRKVVAENNCGDIIEVIGKRAEDIDPSTIEKVDIIVSEWMGFFLLHEFMLDSVIKARDLFLKENGLMFPSTAQLYAAPCQLPSLNDFWDDVYGVSMKCIGEEYRRLKSTEMLTTDVDESDILSDGQAVVHLDLNTVTLEDIDDFGENQYIHVCNKNGRFQGLCMWFAVQFPDGSELSTAPSAPKTYWRQTVLVQQESFEVEQDEPVAYTLEIRKHRDSAGFGFVFRSLDAYDVEHEIPCRCYLTKCIVTRAFLEKMENAENGENGEITE